LPACTVHSLPAYTNSINPPIDHHDASLCCRPGLPPLTLGWPQRLGLFLLFIAFVELGCFSLPRFALLAPASLSPMLAQANSNSIHSFRRKDFLGSGPTSCVDFGVHGPSSEPRLPNDRYTFQSGTSRCGPSTYSEFQCRVRSPDPCRIHNGDITEAAPKLATRSPSQGRKLMGPLTRSTEEFKWASIRCEPGRRCPVLSGGPE